MSQISNICKKYNKDVNDPLVLELREVLKNKLGYFPTFAKWLFNDKTDINGLKDIIVLLNEIKIHKPITSFKSSEDLYDFLTETRNKRKLNQIIKSIPSHSRSHISKRIKDVIYSNIDKEEILKDYFSKKGGRSKTEDDLYQRTLEVINDGGSNDYNEILNKINRIIKPSLYTRIGNFFGRLLEIPNSPNQLEIVYKDGVNIIVKIDSYEISQKLGSKHWCISSSEYHWENYTKNDRTQYFIWQTDKSGKESMIGVTVTKYLGIIRTAHYKDDSRCYNDYLSRYKQYLKGGNIEVDDIEYLINHNVYDLDLVLKTKNWNTYYNDSRRNIYNDLRMIRSANRYTYSPDRVSIEKYFNNVSKTIYFNEIQKQNNRILDFDNLDNRGYGVVDKSDYDYNNLYFQYVLENMDLDSDSFIYLCALIDEDLIDDNITKGKVIKGKILFIINNRTCLDEIFGTTEDVPFSRGPSISMKMGQIDHYFSIKKESFKLSRWSNYDYDKKSFLKHYWKDYTIMENNRIFNQRDQRGYTYHKGYGLNRETDSIYNKYNIRYPSQLSRNDNEETRDIERMIDDILRD